jgi:hypothetical protein
MGSQAMQRYLLCAALLCASLAGCGRKGSGDGPTPLPPNLPGVYAGSAACSNCKAIAATLWLRPDGRFFLRQRYLSEDGAAHDAAYAFGRWSWDERAAELVLRSRGPERRFKRLDGERLEQLATSAAVKSLFTRDPRAPAFTDRVRFEGQSELGERGATFRQCVTGLELPIVNGGDLAELRRLSGALNPSHKLALTVVDGHLVLAALGGAKREQLVIDKVITIKPGSGC